MANSVVVLTSSSITISDMQNIQVTEIQPDDDGFVREVRFYGESDLSVSPVLIHTVRIKSTTRANLEVITPSVRF